jgi:hypothetical protein
VHCSIGRAAIDGDGGTSATRELDDDELLVSPVGITELDSKASPAAAIATSSLLDFVV